MESILRERTAWNVHNDSTVVSSFRFALASFLFGVTIKIYNVSDCQSKYPKTSCGN